MGRPRTIDWVSVIKQVEELWLKELPSVEISRQIGETTFTVSRALKILGLKPHKKHPKTYTNTNLPEPTRYGQPLLEFFDPKTGRMIKKFPSGIAQGDFPISNYKNNNSHKK